MTTPTAQDFKFVIDGQNQQYDAFLQMVEMDNDQWIDCRYRPVNSPTAKWVWLTGPSVFDKDTEEATITDFDRAISLINAEIKTVFGTAGDKPLTGLALMKWLIQVGLKELNNVISRIG